MADGQKHHAVVSEPTALAVRLEGAVATCARPAASAVGSRTGSGVWRLVILFLFIFLPLICHADDKFKIDTDSDVVRDVVLLQESDLTESSGLAVSNVHQSRWWTHNDSGDKPQLYAFNQHGKRTGKCRLSNIQPHDWEDMASFTIDGEHRLVIADCGDNLVHRESIKLYVFDEPDPNDSTEVENFQQLNVTFADGPHDCEAIAVDSKKRMIILITKERLPRACVYVVDLPGSARRPGVDEHDLVATQVTTLPIPMISAMDFDPGNGDLWVVNYFQAFRFSRANDQQPLKAQLSALPIPFVLPKWRQIEAIGVDNDHQVWITSEGKQSPLGRLNLK